jgi:predicted nucleic acid-binding protein
MGSMKSRILLDTVILVDHLNGIGAATRWLNTLKPGEAVISVITRAEVLVGIDETTRDAVLEFLDNWNCLEITADIADLAADLRRAHRWKLPDALQAALAEYHALALATRNTKDFDPKKHHFVRIPYRQG